MSDLINTNDYNNLINQITTLTSQLNTFINGSVDQTINTNTGSLIMEFMKKIHLYLF